MEYFSTEIAGVWEVCAKRYGDARGYFMETWKEEEFREATGWEGRFVQDNESSSVRGVVRGLHFQRGGASQAKLVRVVQGAVVDVAVDLRPWSGTFGKYVARELSDANCRQLFVPRGFAHGFAVLSERAHFVYKVDNVYAPGAEVTLRFDDARVGIEWPFSLREAILSAKDLGGLSFEEIIPIAKEFEDA